MRTQLSPNIINLLGIREKVILSHSKGNRTGLTIYMKPISAEEEIKINKLRDKPDIYFYGDVDPTNKEDIKIITDYNFMETTGLGMLYNNFNYEQGNFKLVNQHVEGEIKGVVKWGPCLDPLLWFKYNHCLIGKPARVVVYNEYYRELFR